MIGKRIVTSLLVAAIAVAAAMTVGVGSAQADTANCVKGLGSIPFLGAPVDHLNGGGLEYQTYQANWVCSPPGRVHLRLEYESGGTWHFAVCNDTIDGNGQPCIDDEPVDGSYTQSWQGAGSVPGSGGEIVDPIDRSTGTSCDWNLRYKATFEFASLGEQDTFSLTQPSTCG